MYFIIAITCKSIGVYDTFLLNHRCQDYNMIYYIIDVLIQLRHLYIVYLQAYYLFFLTAVVTIYALSVLIVPLFLL